MRDNEGDALPSLNSVHASLQRPHPTHKTGSAMTRPLACSMIIRGLSAPRANVGDRADSPIMEAPPHISICLRVHRGFRPGLLSPGFVISSGTQLVFMMAQTHSLHINGINYF
jgi:hypothetical protein